MILVFGLRKIKFGRMGGSLFIKQQSYGGDEALKNNRIISQRKIPNK